MNTPLLPSGLPELQSLKVLKGLGNPETVSRSDVIGLVIGGLAGWWMVKGWSGMTIKYIGVLAGAELGILAVRLVKGQPVTGHNSGGQNA